jgi:hypothetical protein
MAGDAANGKAPAPQMEDQGGTHDHHLPILSSLSLREIIRMATRTR